MKYVLNIDDKSGSGQEKKLLVKLNMIEEPLFWGHTAAGSMLFVKKQSYIE